MYIAGLQSMHALQEEVAGGSKYPDGYDSDLMGDEADRAKMAGMNMLDREMEIFERGEKRRELMDALAAERRVQQSQPQPDKVTNLLTYVDTAIQAQQSSTNTFACSLLSSPRMSME